MTAQEAAQSIAAIIRDLEQSTGTRVVAITIADHLSDPLRRIVEIEIEAPRVRTWVAVEVEP